jgi:hypothetical protein
MARNHFQLKLLYAYLLASMGCAAAETSPETVPRPTVVEAFGYGIPEIGKSEDTLHLEAIADALRNAALQAEVDVDTQVRFEDMRIKERRIRLRSMGTAELSRILDAGVMTNSTPPIYLVHIEASVHPQPASLQKISTSTDGDRLPSGITLTVMSSPDPTLGKDMRNIIAGQLQERGIRVGAPSTESEAITVNVSLIQHADNPTMELQWEMGRTSAATATGSLATDRIKGYRFVSVPDQLPLELEKLGETLALDAARFGALP